MRGGWGGGGSRVGRWREERGERKEERGERSRVGRAGRRLLLRRRGRRGAWLKGKGGREGGERSTME